jgi:threonine/homoserine/homoserine lactone efflux protein
MVAALWKSFVFGALLAAAIGPIALLIFSTAARQGLAAGGYAGLGAALADLLYALVAFSAGAVLLPLVARHEAAIRVSCSLLLVGLGAAMLMGTAPERSDRPSPDRVVGRLVPTFLLTIVNPMTFVIFAGIAPQLPVAGSPANAVLLAAALFAGSLAVQLAIAGAGAATGRALPGPRWQRTIRAAAGLGIVAFGVAGLVSRP